jgi:quercetin dioxygenase-like cupin family protein
MLRGSLLLALTVLLQNPVLSQDEDVARRSPLPWIVSFNPDSTTYQNLFDGEKDSVIFYSGVVTLPPNATGEIHNTRACEEMIIPLEGKGQLRLKDQEPLILTFGKIAYIPPHTEHHTANTGIKNFKYIYVAVKSKE